jgi:hypothetical protein
VAIGNRGQEYILQHVLDGGGLTEPRKHDRPQPATVCDKGRCPIDTIARRLDWPIRQVFKCHDYQVVAAAGRVLREIPRQPMTSVRCCQDKS